MTVIPFETIEQDKENIEPALEGRAASALRETFSKDHSDRKTEHSIKRGEFQARLQDVDDLDDPLEPYLEYVKWIKDSFPEGNSVESELIAVLENCTEKFRDTPYYKNDPRYLKVWLDYCRYCPDPKDVFAYLLSKSIGMGLATFYEKYAAYLESTGQTAQAAGVFEMGLQASARPVDRLKRKYWEFQQRNATAVATEIPSSTIVRPALALKEGATPSFTAQGSTNNPDKGSKVGVFLDPSGESSQASATSQWDSLGSLASRRKENLIKPSQWTGQTLSLDPESRAPPRSMVRPWIDSDPALTTTRFQQPKPVPGKKAEHIPVDLALLHNSKGEEIPLFEALLTLRGASCEDRHPIPLTTPSRPRAKLSNVAERPGLGFHGESQQTQNPPATPNSGPRTFSTHPITVIRSPTVTAFTLKASEEVLQMMNQPIGQNNTGELLASNIDRDNAMDDDDDDDDDDDEDGDDDDDDDDGEDDDEEEDDDDDENHKDQNHSRIENKDAPLPEARFEVRGSENSRNPTYMRGISEQTRDVARLQHHCMTPIAEATEVSLTSAERLHQQSQYSQTPCRGPIPDKLERPNCLTKQKQIADGWSSKLAVGSQYKRFRGVRLSSEARLRKHFESAKGQSRTSMLSFPNLSESLCIRKVLGQGGFGTVYLAETDLGRLEALKIERGTVSWEYLLLSEVHRRITCDLTRASIIKCTSCYEFDDEICTRMEYMTNGTLLNLVNSYKALDGSKSGLSESASVYFTLQVANVLLALHGAGFIHGDIKADNVMIRDDDGDLTFPIKYSAEWWRNKGIKLIDFGRAIDMREYKSETRFLADWKTDSHDCVEMQQGKAWTFEADYYGLAGLAHLMLFGSYIKIAKDPKTGRWRLHAPLKRYWQQSIWTRFFDLLLNSSLHKLPLSSELAETIASMDDWLRSRGEDTNVALRRELRECFEKSRQSVA